MNALGVFGFGLGIFFPFWQSRHPEMDDRIYYGGLILGVVLMVGGLLHLVWSTRPILKVRRRLLALGNVPRKYRLRWPVTKARLSPGGVENDADLHRFREEWDHRETRELARQTAITYVANHPEMHKEFDGKTNEELVAQVDDYRRQARQAEAMINRIDVWLVSMLPPQHITGEMHTQTPPPRGGGEGHVESHEADAAVEKILPLPDEQLVILYNSFAVPAYVAMTTALNEVFEQCFRKHGGALGLAARYFKDFVFVPGNKTLERVRECIADPSAGSLQEAFDEFFGHYTSTTAFIWHDAALKVLPQPTSATDWSERDDEFKKQIVVLSGGLNRQALRNLVGFNRETWPMPQQVAEWANRPPEEPAEATE